MRLLILGATGPCGIALIRKALAVHPDYTIVVYARNPQKLPNDIQNNASVTIIQGTLDELDKLEQALEGVDAVISALGPIPFQTTGTPIADFYGRFIDLLYKHNIKRFMPLATPSHRDEHDGKQWKFTTLVTVIRNIAKQHVLRDGRDR
ncbi:hypothetical protein NLJ89_g4117 [Agrocybe chaxingu]|uniref:NAD(P)-binding domain-containing protein n=1 Tax=Agrocybe chaxingu TaxID=84603 RepID=A0A9W8K3H5_9AGAR|nr:hypothetical protein NLJ89_g4117 [Agrocybe chaxingu]